MTLYDNVLLIIIIHIHYDLNFTGYSYIWCCQQKYWPNISEKVTLSRQTLLSAEHNKMRRIKNKENALIYKVKTLWWKATFWRTEETLSEMNEVLYECISLTYITDIGMNLWRTQCLRPMEMSKSPFFPHRD